MNDEQWKWMKLDEEHMICKIEVRKINTMNIERAWMQASRDEWMINLSAKS